MTSMRMAGLAAAVAAILGAGQARARASLITYTETLVATGTFGAASFTGATLTFTQTADTANVVFTPGGPTPPPYSVYRVVDATSSISIAGGGLATTLTGNFTDATTSFANAFGTAGLSDPAVFGTVIAGTTDPSLATYNLQSSIGPIANTASTTTFLAFKTDGGNLKISSTSGPATFGAVTAATSVPEPSSLALVGIAGTVALALARARRARIAARVDREAWAGAAGEAEDR